jgi:hypothetical protein
MHNFISSNSEQIIPATEVPARNNEAAWEERNCREEPKY